MLAVEIRDQLAYKKLVRLSMKRIFHKESTKTWNTHVLGLHPYDMDFDTVKTVLANALLSGYPVRELTHNLHQNSAETVLEDKEITLEFIKICQETFTYDS
jgi:hypothetical protein